MKRLKNANAIIFTGGMIILYIIAVSIFSHLSDKYSRDISPYELTGEGYSESTGTVTGLADTISFYFEGTDEFAVNYLDITVDKLSEKPMNAGVFSADDEGQYKKIADIYIDEGYNEVKIKNGASYRLDIQNGNALEFDLEGISLRTAPSPRCIISNSIVIYAVFMALILYVLIRLNAFERLGTLGLSQRLVLGAEALFMVFLFIIMLYGIGDIRFKICSYALIPLAAAALALMYSGLKEGKINSKLITPCVLIAMLVLLCVVGFKMVSEPNTDLGTVYYSAWEIVDDGHVSTVFTGSEKHSYFFKESNNAYFMHYTANIPILALLALFYKVLSVFGLNRDSLLSNYMSILLNIAFIMGSVILTLKTAKNVFGKKGSLAALVMCFTFVPFYINACRFYTDTLSMLFVAAAFYVYSSSDEKFKYVWLKYALAGAAICAGALIKGSVYVVLVAFIIHLLLKGIKNLRCCAVMLAVIAVLSGVWGVYIDHCSWIDMSQEESMEFPLVHWIMMGMNRSGGGGYVQSDFEYTAQFPSKEEKKAADLEMLSKRFAELGTVDGAGDYLFNKSAGTWLEGQFMQSVHMDWVLKKGGLFDFLSADREHYSLYNIYIVVYIFCIFIFVAAGGIFALRSPKADYGMLLRLTLLGAVIFFMLWESKSRYILNFAPVFMLSAVYGLEGINKALDEGQDKGKASS